MSGICRMIARLLNAIGAGLLLAVGHARLHSLGPVRACLLALHRMGLCAFHTILGAHLLTLGALRLRGHSFGALRPFGPLHPRGGTFGALRPRLRLGALPAALVRFFDAIVGLMASRLRTGRGRDRQRGDAGCEENPGHKKSPLNGKTVRSLHRSHA